jgi:hypothetical protein
MPTESKLFKDPLKSSSKFLADYDFLCDNIHTFQADGTEVIDANIARKAFTEMANKIALLEKLLYLRNN